MKQMLNTLNISDLSIKLYLCVPNFKAIIYVTRPAKIGHVGTNYTLSHSRSYLSTGIENLYSVTCIIQPIKCLPCAKNCIAIAYCYKKL